MNITIKKSTAKGKVSAQPSKSAAHRLIIAAALADGSSEIKGIKLSEDIKATLNAAKAIGTSYTYKNEILKINSNGLILNEETIINCNESGSTLRFMIPILLTSDKEVIFTGADSLLGRPLGIYEDICNKNSLLFEKKDDGIHIKGPLKGGEYVIDGNISSQFITGLLFALPLLKDDSVIKINPPIESKPYVEMTLDTLKKAGIEFSFSENKICIYGNQQYLPLSEKVEGDWSNAAFLDAFNLIGGNVLIEGLDNNSKQGDKIYRKFFGLFNGSHNDIPQIDLADFPDLAPILMSVAAIKGGAVFTGTKRLKFKECDRGSAMKEELSKFGIITETEEDKITVKKGKLISPTLPLKSHNDHRIAMAISLPASIVGGTIEGAEAVNKSYPEYWQDIKNLGIEVLYE